MDPGGGLKLVEDKLKKGFGATVASDVVNQIKLRSTRLKCSARLAVHSNSLLVIVPQSLLSSCHDDPI